MTTSIRDFVPLEKLGEGSYSSVYKVKRLNDGQIYALKKVKLGALSRCEQQNSLNQVRLLASIECPHIVSYKEAFFDDGLQALCVVMEFADGGDLTKIIKKSTPLPEAQIWKALQHILLGLKCLHERGILHRDLKCANVFKQGEIYQLGDLNVSKVNGDRLAMTQTGTPYYASPEVWRSQPYGSASDIWSLGCLLYEMAAGTPPFSGNSLNDLYESIHKKRQRPVPSRYSTDLNQVITLCLQKTPQKRPTAKQILESNVLRGALRVHGIRQQSTAPGSNQNLLRTIKMPNDVKWLNLQLPSAKYKSPTPLLKHDKSIDRSLNMNKDRIIVTENPSKNDKPAAAKSNRDERPYTNKSANSIQPSNAAEGSHSQRKEDPQSAKGQLSSILHSIRENAERGLNRNIKTKENDAKIAISKISYGHNHSTKQLPRTLEASLITEVKDLNEVSLNKSAISQSIKTKNQERSEIGIGRPPATSIEGVEYLQNNILLEKTTFTPHHHQSRSHPVLVAPASVQQLNHRGTPSTESLQSHPVNTQNKGNQITTNINSQKPIIINEGSYISPKASKKQNISDLLKGHVSDQKLGQNRMIAQLLSDRKDCNSGNRSYNDRQKNMPRMERGPKSKRDDQCLELILKKIRVISQGNRANPSWWA